MLRGFHCKKAIVIGVVVFSFLFLQRDGFAGEAWEQITELSTKRRGFATAVVDGKIYLIGGTRFENEKGPYGMSLVEVYEPQTNTWQRRAEMPTPREGAQAAVVNGIIYVFGGSSGKDNKVVNQKYLDVVEAYNPQTDTWIQKNPMPVSRISFDLGVMAGKVYLIGGSTGFGAGHEKRTDRVDVYEPATDTWGKGRNMPTRRDAPDVEVVNNRIYAIGGAGWPQVGNRGGPDLKVIEEYTPKTHRWRKKKEMPELRTSFRTVVVGTDIYLIGGFVSAPKGLPALLATVAVYRPQKETWRESAKLPMPLRPFGAAAVHGKIYVFGGYSGEEWDAFPDVLVFDTGFRAVTASGKLPVRWGALKMERQSRP